MTTTTIYGLINSHMFGHPNELREDWSTPDFFTAADMAALELGDAATYAAAHPHMIVWEVTA